MDTKTRDALTRETFRRDLTLDRKSVNTEARTVPASLSSETPVERWFGNEILSHAQDAIDLSRALDGLPMLFGHDHSQPIGLVHDVKIDNGKLRGVLHFSNNAKAREVFQDVQEGFLKNISIGYAVKEWSENSENDDVTITRWELLETSVVPVPADKNVGINRSKGDPTMDTKDLNKGPEDKAGDNLKLIDFEEARQRAINEGRQEGLKLERERTDAIENLFLNFKAERYQSLKAECIRQGTSKERASELLLEMVGKDAEPLARTSSDNHKGDLRVQRGEDSLDKMKRGMTEALKVKVQVEKEKEAVRSVRENEFFSMNPVELARHYLQAIGFDTRGMNRLNIVGEAFVRAPGMHGTSDFANILANVSNAALLMGYNEAPETWAAWCRKGNLTDFKVANRVNLSEFGDLSLVKENGEYEHGNFSDSKETIQLAKYGKLFSITREALINDDLDALGRIPASMGRAAARKVGDIAYAILTANANMADGNALFSAAHSNIETTGAAPSVSTVDAGRVAMGTQTGPKGATLGIRPAHLIVPLALQGTATALMAAQYDPAGTAGTLTPNTVQGIMNVIADARLDSDSAVKWYMAADSNQADTVEVAFLDGNDQPWMEQVNEFTRDGITHKVRIEAAAAALDHRGLYHNDGA